VREHWVAALCLGGRNFFLKDIPVFAKEPVGDAKDIDADERLWPPADVAAVDHDVIAFGNDDAGSVVEFGREMRSDLLQACAAGWDDGVVLDVVGSEDFIEKREVTIIEDASEGFEGEGFIRGESRSVLRIHRLLRCSVC
jgi:hypothetical protein